MLPLAVLLRGMGHRVSGSDRSRDQGRLPEKFAWLESQGVTLYPQDGSGVRQDVDTVAVSKAVEDTILDIAAAKEKSIPIALRADVMIELFNAAATRIAISGTSGKTTTTGMIGFLLKEAGLDPSVMNGGIFRNYAHENPYSTAFVGRGDIFVSEIDESDGAAIMARYAPDIAVLHNISLDHKPMEELKDMFAGFMAQTKTAIVNADDPGVMEIAKSFTGRVISYGIEADADIMAAGYKPEQDGSSCSILQGDLAHNLRLRVPGRHNVSNALAAIAVAHALGMDIKQAVEILARFEGIKRRMEMVGSVRGISVMDDFAHNPDKISATLSTLKEFPGRLLVFFQPHGYGFLKIVRDELMETFASGLAGEDRLYLVEPLYLGGTVDKSVGSSDIVQALKARGVNAALMPNRAAVCDAVAGIARAGDRIVVMGARDDTLSAFAAEILQGLSGPCGNQ